MLRGDPLDGWRTLFDLNDDVRATTPDEVAAVVRDHIARSGLLPADRVAAIMDSFANADTVAAGVAGADEEYLQRLAKGDGTTLSEHDGLLRALPLPPSTDPLAEILIRHRIMATYRQSDRSLRTGASRVTLLTITSAGERVRGTLHHRPTLLADDPSTTLGDVVRAAAASTDGQARLRAVLGESALDEILGASR